MVAMVVRHRVADFDAWKPIFDEHGTVRRQHGAVGHELYRAAADPNDVVIVIRFATAEGAAAFLADPSLKEAMQRAGVVSEPEIAVTEHTETVDYAVKVG